MGWEYPRLSRRAFLHAAGGAAAGTGLLRPFTAASGHAGTEAPMEEYSYTIRNFCSSLRNVRVTTRTQGGVKRAVKLDGNPHSTLNRGKLCARDQSGLRQTYDSDRGKTPIAPRCDVFAARKERPRRYVPDADCRSAPNS